MLRGLTVVDVALLSAGVYILKAYFDKRAKAGQQLPPGPKGLPVVGNVADMPKEKEWLTFTEWGRKFGGICAVSLLGRPMIIVNSIDALEEFDKKSAIYSERPILEMGGELVGYSETLVLMRYGSRFRHYRKQFARYIGNGVVQDQHPLLIDFTQTFLKRVLKEPDNLMAHLRKLTGGIILKITYGYDVQDGNDPFVDLIEGANESFNIASKPGNFMVDVFPSLKNLPSWFPGAGFLETAARWKKNTDAMVEVPYKWTKSQMAAGTAPESFVSTSIEDGDELTESERNDIKFVAASLYGGGADTTVSAQYAFFLAMVLNPDVQKKAQEEIDRVVGNDRLPNHDDRPNMPYLNAVLTEVLRWNSVAPSGVPHVAIEDGFVGGYFIPKDSMILANLWGILHDPQTYPSPFQFDPERFIAGPGKEVQRDPRGACFGFGRRVCPGMYLAEASLWSTITMSLAVFDITNTIEDGVAVVPVHENTSGTISYPKPYKCSIRPRSPKALALITESA
ncbi:hypothetical protein D9611_013581 [Ephemerocybe angulata]|uniref:Cytochrome P450 n=1 Tax=Ephemerocybe angulata TaxID=980116 RepID=A0A8H5ERK3_9AGAR|nr:hypothetical protein D9611_013581 [Tulosesus angulatus]